jgi:hypothetical protein
VIRLIAKGYVNHWSDPISEHAPQTGDRIAFDGFALVVQGVTWLPGDQMNQDIKCSIIRANWDAELDVLLGRAGFVEQR